MNGTESGSLSPLFGVSVAIPSLHTLMTTGRHLSRAAVLSDDMPPLLAVDAHARARELSAGFLAHHAHHHSSNHQVHPVVTSSSPMPGAVMCGSPILRRSARLARSLGNAAPVEAAEPNPEPPSTTSHRKRSRSVSTNNSKSSNKRAKTLKQPPPPPSVVKLEALLEEDLDDKKPAADAATCTICMCEPERAEISSLDGCAHRYCFACICQWSERENTCPLCKARFTRIARLHPQRKKKGAGSPVKNTKRVKQRDQRSDIIPGAALERLLASIANGAALNHHGGSRLGRYIVATQLGNGARRVRPPHMDMANRRPTRLDAAGLMPPPFFGFDDDEEDGILGIIPGFMNAILRSHREAHHQELNADIFPGLTARMSLAGLTAGTAAPHTTTTYTFGLTRSHATNANDVSAGYSPENALEIDDSDEEVEFVQVTRTA